MKPRQKAIRRVLVKKLPWSSDTLAYNKERYKADDHGPVWDFVEDNEETYGA
jgi:hypothetical protein